MEEKVKEGMVTGKVPTRMKAVKIVLLRMETAMNLEKAHADLHHRLRKSTKCHHIVKLLQGLPKLFLPARNAQHLQEHLQGLS